MKFFGIADAHGIESFNPSTLPVDFGDTSVDNQQLSFMILRANANRHRHAVVYLADLDVQGAKEVNDLIKAGEYVGALEKLKEVAITISLAKSPGAEKSWKLIPNPDLDPYS